MGSHGCPNHEIHQDCLKAFELMILSEVTTNTFSGLGMILWDGAVTVGASFVNAASGCTSTLTNGRLWERLGAKRSRTRDRKSNGWPLQVGVVRHARAQCTGILSMQRFRRTAVRMQTIHPILCVSRCSFIACVLYRVPRGMCWEVAKKQLDLGRSLHYFLMIGFRA